MGFWEIVTEGIKDIPVSTVLRERLELAADKYASLEAKLEASELRANELEAENHRLRLDSSKLEQRVIRLEKQLAERHDERLEETREKMLCLLARHPRLTAIDVAQALSIGEQLAMFHLSELKSSGLIGNTLTVNQPILWHIDHEGRAYLVAHGLLE
ncbi:MAG: winged helix-turn-helix transcriptional regulator [Gammaproteobacteria bacterium]